MDIQRNYVHWAMGSMGVESGTEIKAGDIDFRVISRVDVLGPHWNGHSVGNG